MPADHKPRWHVSLTRESMAPRPESFSIIAHRMEIDPLELRRTNLSGPEQRPFERRVDAIGTPVIYDSGSYLEALQTAIDTIGYAALRDQLAGRRADGEMVGLGLALFVEKSGLGPDDEVRVTLGASGEVDVITGAASLGQGMETVIAQVCAEYLGADIDSIRVIHGQTDQIGQGMGAFASRVTVMTGSATQGRASISGADIDGGRRPARGRPGRPRHGWRCHLGEGSETTHALPWSMSQSLDPRLGIAIRYGPRSGNLEFHSAH